MDLHLNLNFATSYAHEASVIFIFFMFKWGLQLPHMLIEVSEITYTENNVHIVSIQLTKDVIESLIAY